MSRAVLSLGSNLDDREAHLRAAVAGLGESILAVSGVYETPAWGELPQPDFLNAVALVVDPAAGPADWLALARQLETAAGRLRDPALPAGPRSLDVDVITVWGADGAPVRSDDPELTLPHPRAHLRAFVLRPWLDIQPYAELPGHGWVYDLVRRPPVVGDLGGLRVREDISLEAAI
ncbi:MAG TPA: 2-amino-4-hydroxy-6-hydroxymethyldihydropteridine diphosphokinase [Micromonosporaceae bacterium]|nr:2-amino-4-hydroxy-6-hydroxymethyldihydropteridine diphosphokinase [Micromonosporaceae bacterium]